MLGFLWVSDPDPVFLSKVAILQKWQIFIPVILFNKINKAHIAKSGFIFFPFNAEMLYSMK